MAGLFGAKMPKLTSPTRMPDENDPALREARRRKLAELTSRKGSRESTLLSQQTQDKLGASGS